MTAHELLDVVLALLFAADDADERDYYQPLFLSQLNLKLAECFARNNALREFRGKEPLPAPPHISAMTNEVPYEDELALLAFPYGIAGELFAPDDETGIANFYRQRYMDFLGDAQRAFFREVTS